MRLSLALVALLTLFGERAGAQTAVVTSAAPDAVAVTIYRAPSRAADAAMDLDWLEGYALITETRTVDVPAGEATIRFEGVAGGMLPETALVTGLPQGVREKNLDADLLSARSLFDRNWGRPVILRRHKGRDGKGTQTEERAVIRSSADGAAIVQTRDGIEVADCGRRLTDQIVYPELPPGLSARPTLSVRTVSDSARRATVKLSYLAWGFDWQTNYTIRYDPGTGKADMLAWVTLASSDPTSFVDATAAVVGGEVNREGSREDADRPDGELVLQCYLKPQVPRPAGMSLPPPPPMPMAVYAPAAEIIVTAQRRSEKLMDVATVVQEEGLGDLKLYRVPVPTTVASNAQKQVAMHDLHGVKWTVLHTATLDGASDGAATGLLLRTKNAGENGLGFALPGGPVALFEPHGADMLLVGQGGLGNYAIGQDVEVSVGTSPQVRMRVEERAEGDHWKDYEAIVTNANPWPVRFEGTVTQWDGQTLENVSAKLGRRNGRAQWTVTVPANGVARLRYRRRDAP
ncbi:DUF4139 domain-containing protein [Novosphingobium colocasiae]|uniref:DUF4139 domain-containing protein n=1 Tax=Novosphingobium colocasiae TaxID=1256513 RepID=A0A918P9Q5_9SPHN|nr:hypothetical protein [Novosphingobium colocasiae]GGY92342.1 hypothetical protein GCM10011614_03880 [Novosphingobium colocasiae]